MIKKEKGQFGIKKIKTIVIKVEDGLFNFFEWDKDHYQITSFISLIIVLSAIKIPSPFSLQWFLLLLGFSVIQLFNFARGHSRGRRFEQKIHEELFVCLPREVITQLQNHEETFHHHHSHEDDEEKKRNVN